MFRPKFLAKVWAQNSTFGVSVTRKISRLQMQETFVVLGLAAAADDPQPNETGVAKSTSLCQEKKEKI